MDRVYFFECVTIFGVGAACLIGSYQQGLPWYIAKPAYGIGLVGLFISAAMFFAPAILPRFARPKEDKTKSLKTSSRSVGPKLAPEWLEQAFTALVLILGTVGIADGLVRLMDMVIDYRSSSKLSSEIRTHDPLIELERQEHAEEAREHADEERKHSLPPPLSSDDHKLLVRALTDQNDDEHPYRIKILAQDDQKCQALAAEMTAIFKSAHWNIPKEDVPREFCKIGKGLTVASSLSSPPIMAAMSIRQAFNELGIQYIQEENPALRHLDYVLVKIGDK